MRKKLWVLLAVLVVGAVRGQSDEALVPLVPQTVLLTDDSSVSRFAFEAQAGEVWSFTAQTARFESVDPVLKLYASDGVLLLENDNESRTSTDARLEAWTAPANGVYALEVAREGLARGITSGNAILTAIPGYSQLVFSADSLLLSDSPLVISEESTPLDMRFTVSDINTGFSLVSAGWQLEILPDGWRLTTQAETGLSPVFAADFAFGVGNYQLLVTPTAFNLSVDGESVIAIAREIRVGGVTLVGGASFASALATTPFYDGEIALPPVAPQERLYSEAFNPLEIMAELGSLGYAVETGGLTLRVPRGLIETANTGYSLYPLNTGDDVTDFVLSFEGRIPDSGVGAACGMTFRQVNAENFAAVLFSEEGNLYILQYVGGELLPMGLAVQSIWVDPTENAVNWVVLVVQDDTATVYVNGRLAGRGNITEQAGALQLGVYLNEPVYTLCTLDNLWLWELE